MGQGYSLTTLSAGSAGIDVPELSDLVYEKSMGGGRFMKSIRARQQNGLVFVKVIMKPYPTMQLEPYVKAIIRERKLLSDVPNALSYERILETSTSGYMVRQYIHSSLYDRMSTRPFLEDIEKKWIAFQLLCALRDSHSLDVFHGDIKTENVLVTSWNWLYLSDYSSSFKPTFLPEDNPADFSFYFDTSGRRTCYLAPERFLVAGEEPGNRHVNWAMDIFSAGCVIAELFLESPIFTLSQIYKYRKGEYSPEHSQLVKIEDPEIRELILHMIQLEPESRYSAEEYLNFWKTKAFPEYFYSFLHQYMSLMTDPSSGRTKVDAESNNRGETDDRIERVCLDFDKISYFLGIPPRTSPCGPCGMNAAPRLTGNILPVKLDLPDGDGEVDGNQMTVSSPGSQSDEGVLIFLSLVVSNLRTTSKASARIKACDILLAFAEKLSDEAKLDRVLPYVMILVADRTDSVKVAAIRTLTQLLEMVHVVTPVNAYLFPEYIFPRLQPFIISSKHNPSPMVRAAYASCIASLAQSSLRFLDMVQALRSDTRLTSLIPVGFEPRWTEDATYHNLYDVARIDLLEYFEVHTKALLTDTDASVRRAFLGSVSSLCVFFGNLKANEVILSHLNTYLNDRDWILKCAFFEAVVGVAAYVGSTNLEQYILPLMIQSMTEPEEFVVEKVIRSLAAMADLGLFQRSTTWDLLHITIGFLVHPNIWIREAAVSFVVKSTKFLSVADIFSILTPLIRPYLKVKTVGFTEAELLDALKRPMSRKIYEMVFLWASKTDKGIFWKSASRDAFSLSEPGSHSSRLGRSVSLSMSSQTKNEEDEQWLSRLRNLGMTVEDEFKILALRDYICKVSLRQSRDVETETTLPFGEIISLSQQGVTPQTVFFDKNLNDKSRNTSLERNTSRTRNHLDDPRPRTIADALLDASTTIERSPSAHRKHTRTQSQLHKEIEIPHQREIAFESSSSSPAAPGSRPLSPPGPDVEQHTIHANRGLSSGQGSSSTTPTNADTLSLTGLPVQRKSSAINLLNRNDTAKAYAETGTSSANAFGKVDAPIQRGGTPQPSVLSHALDRKPTQAVMASRRYRANHSYTGDDPVVLRLLDNVFAENYPTDLFDLGPYVKEIESRQPIPKANSQNVNKIWKPEGNLVATFGEHSGPVNRIALPPDHSFFVTASDDSTVKVWDTIRLERNLTPRSRLTHRHSSGARVKALTFVENTYTFVSGATDGSIHAVRIDYQKVNENTRYGKLQLVREYQLPVAENGLQEYAVWMDHFREEGQSTLLIATNTCRILALDMKTMLPIFTLENPVHHGTPTTFCCDRRHTWLLIGTTHGVLDLWDLRFRVRLKAWGLPGWGYIHRVQLHPIKSRGRWVCVSSSGSRGNEITVWDIEKFRCREVYQAAPPNFSDTAAPNGGATTTHHRSSRGTATGRAPRLSARDFEAWPVDEDRPEGMLSRFATTSPAAAGIETGPSAGGNNGSAAAPTNLAGDRMGMLAFTGGLNAPDDDKAASSNSKLGFIVSAGSDRRIRFWDLANPAGSMIVSGLDAVANGTAASKPQYETTQPGPNLSMVIEHMPRSSGDSAAAAGSKKGASPRPPRGTVISLQQQMLLKSHLDIIQDVAVLRQPYGMIVSVDRAGMVYVFK
ncbi:Serine/threonine-protein kinase ppk19 [Penicillium rolfsii]|nr:Serine/threonine-protein kinase ppk19 [Penicillium rolfsii]